MADAPISLANQQAYLFPRLPQALPYLEPAAAGATPGWWFHALRAVTLDPRTGHVHWATEPCGGGGGAGEEGQELPPCLGSLTSIQLLRQQTLGGAQASPACRSGGVGFSLDPDDPREPLGKLFRKRFYPEECADAWSDLLPGAVLFQADWDLKLLLHNVDGVGDALGPWYRPIEAWYREEAVPLGQETLGKVWLVAEAVEAAEAPLGLALGAVTLRLKAAAVRKDPDSPTGLVEEDEGREGKPVPRALARFVAAANAHMPELVRHFPSFGHLQQLVLAQEAARFLRDRGVALPVDPGLAAMRSPLTGLTRVPAVQMERRRLVTMAGVVGVGGGSGGNGQAATDDEAAVWLRGLGPVALGLGSTALVGLNASEAAVRAFSCGVRNATLRDLASLDALFRSGATLDCRAERGMFDPFGGAGGPRQRQADKNWAADDEDERAGAQDDRDGCDEALTVWSEQLEAWRPWPSRALPPPPPTATNELTPVPLGTYNATGRVVLLEEAEETGGNGGGDAAAAVVVLAWEGQVARAEAAVRRLNATALLVVLTEGDDGGDGGSSRSRRQPRRGGGKSRATGEEDAVLRRVAARLPVRLLGPEVGEELRALARLSALDDEEAGDCCGGGSGLQVWVACGVERALDGAPSVEEEDEGEGPREVVHDGVEYRTLDAALIASQRRGCQTAALPIPEGFEVAPAYPDVIEGVVKPHPWATASLLLRATDHTARRLALPPVFAAYTTATAAPPRRAGERLEFGAGLMVINASTTDDDGGIRAATYRPFRCDTRVLLRRAATTVAYAGYLYRALDEGAAVDGAEVPPGPPPDFTGLKAAAARLPVGGEGWSWEISPADRGVAQQVAAAHPWGTDVLILADNLGYPTQLYYHRKAQQQQESAGDPGPLVPHHRVLIRRPLQAWEAGGGGSGAGHGESHRVSDAYRIDASARLSFRRLRRGDGGAGERGLRYLLEMEVAERVMIHGGVDLTGVRRVPLPEAGGGGGGGGGGESAGADAQLLVALERAAADGRLGRDGVWREGDRAYTLVSMAGLDDGEEE